MKKSITNLKKSSIPLNSIYFTMLMTLLHAIKEVQAATLHSVSGSRRDVLDVEEADADDRIVITTDPKHGKVIVDQKNDTITYIPDGSGKADSYEYELQDDDGFTCASTEGFLMCLLIMGGIAALPLIAGGSGGSRDGGTPPPPLKDFGDAPEEGESLNFETTLANDGARHIIDEEVHLGSQIDSEVDGQPTLNADGDDLANLNDHDGVEVVTFSLDENIKMNVIASTTGNLSVWFDLNNNGQWDNGEKVFDNVTLNAGNNIIMSSSTLSELISAVTGGEIPPTEEMYARFRFSTESVDQPFGELPDGEVEDYLFTIGIHSDFGDAPNDPTASEFFPTTLSDTGAWHNIVVDGAEDPLLKIGTLLDDENDGKPNSAATGDDLDTSDDEDGVTLIDNGGGNYQASIDITNGLSEVAYLTVFFDADQNNMWTEDEKIFDANIGDSASQTILVDLPSDLTSLTSTESYYLRVRLSTDEDAIDTPSGYAPDGEVEDHLIEIVPKDYGDAPDNDMGDQYQTLAANTGARHIIDDSIYLGPLIDAELDGLQSLLADGDDLDNLDDEGIELITFTGDQKIVVGVDAVGSGNLSAWFDLNDDGDWDADEMIFDNIALSPGMTLIESSVTLNEYLTDAGAAPDADSLYARFRYSTETVDSPSGELPDGEVEDYLFFTDTLVDYGDAPNDEMDFFFPTTFAKDGARHTISLDDQSDPTLFFGVIIDNENDGQPTTPSDGDDMNGDDEDGLTHFDDGLTSQKIGIDITNVENLDAFLTVFLDINQDGNWSVDEKIHDLSLGNVGIQSILLDLPDGLTSTEEESYYLRMRLSSDEMAIDLPTGFAPDGEVEDHLITIDAIII